ncbi:MAG: hypothetical protein PHU06_06835 [Gallionella sp.]|nr:hypothetical protein [Gallionella sp.]MDD4958025.1 hypothetical protein [Gallionella sp.]
MAAVLAFHHCSQFGRVLADKYGNDPFVWVMPFLWSHCHARSRPKTFGEAKNPPFVRGRDAVFFVTHHPKTRKLVCDCVFVIDKVMQIKDAEAYFPISHPARHFHFDHGQSRNPHHVHSSLTRIADTKLSFVLDPPMPIDWWIEQYVRYTGNPVSKYFQAKRIKNVRVIDRDANGLYNRTLKWTRRRGHGAHAVLPMRDLRLTVRPSHPANGQINWYLK